MTKRDVVQRLVGEARSPVQGSAEAYADTNLALCKYWGKRDEELNLPLASSLSVALRGLGTRTRIDILNREEDRFELNGEELPPESPFARRLADFLDLFRPPCGLGFWVRTVNQMPTGAGLASSASGFASLVLALNELFGWKLGRRELSILARLGSGSAARSLFKGFVVWHAGQSPDGMDSYAEPLPHRWPELRVGVLTLHSGAKELGSREAMQRTVRSSPYLRAWVEKCRADFDVLLEAIGSGDFRRFGRTSESNALAMHAAALAAWPPILYFRSETIHALKRVWALRREGHELYFTVDAGPNVKLLFLEELEKVVRDEFPGVRVLRPFPEAL